MKLTIFLILLLVSSIPVNATADSNKQGQTVYVDEIKTDYRRVRSLAGLQLGVIRLDLTELNDILADFDDFNNQMIISGGSGVAGIREDHRFGVVKMTGQQIVGSTKYESASLYLDYYGLLYEYGLYAKNRVDLAGGLMLGSARVDLRLQHKAIEDFDDGINDPKATVFDKNFLVLEPRLNLHYKVNPLLGLDLSAGYLTSYNKTTEWNMLENRVDNPIGNFSGMKFSLQFSLGF